MKRAISCLMVLLLIAALLPAGSAEAFAAEANSEQTLTWSIGIPSLYTIRTNTDESQFFGNVNVTISDDSKVSTVDLYPAYTDLINTTDSSNKLPIEIYENGTNAISKTGERPLCLFWSGHQAVNGFDSNGYANRSLSVKVTDWTKARINEKYVAEINYYAIIKLKDGNTFNVTNIQKGYLEVIVQPMTYNVVILPSKNIEYAVTGTQELGKVTVASVSSDAEELNMTVEYTDLVNTKDANDRLSLKLITDRYGELNKSGYAVQTKSALPVYKKNEKSPAFNSLGISEHTISAVVPDWSKATPGATYTAEVIYKISGKNTTGQTYNNTVSEKSTITVVIPEAKKISSVDLLYYRSPMADQTAYSYYSGLALNNTHLEIKENVWFCVTDSHYMSNSEKFETGKTYQLRVKAAAKDGYIFDSNVKYTVNGYESYAAANECSVDTIVSPQVATLWVKSYSIPKDVEKKIENVNLTGYNLPLAGQLVKDYDFSSLTTNDVHMKITKAQWINKDNNTVLAQGDKFESNVNYSLKVEILADKGYVPQASTMRYYVNGKEENADYKASSIEETVVGYVINLWAAPVKLNEPVSKDISTINIVGYTNPVAGKTIGEYDFAALKPEVAARYTLTSAAWYDETAKSYPDTTDKFMAGNSYTLVLKVTADKDYTIANEKNLVVKINNEEKLADNKFTTVEEIAGIYSAKFWSASYKIPMPEKYTVKVTNKGSGTVTSSVTSIEAGNKVTVTALPVSDKYRFKEWVVVAGSLTAADIKLTDASKGQYEFTMPAVNVELQAVFEAVPVVTPTEKTKRLGGTDRFGTADIICKEGWTKSATVVIASGADYPDALAGTVLAGKLGAPILLTGKNSITNNTLKQIKDLGATNAYILGGKAAVSENVEKALKDNGLVVTRVYGDTRNGTAAEIAYRVADKAETVYLVSNRNFADALSVSAGAAIQKFPILYLNPDGTIPAETKAALTKLGTKNAIIIGGPAAVNGSANDKIRTLGISVSRIYGSDRYETSIKVYDELKKLSVFTSKDAAVATGKAFPDALSGAAFAANKGMPVLLAGTTATQELIDRTKDAGCVYIFGGTSAVSDTVKSQLDK